MNVTSFDIIKVSKGGEQSGHGNSRKTSSNVNLANWKYRWNHDDREGTS